MTKNKQKNPERVARLEPVRAESELSSFVERDLPPEEDVRRFDSYLKGGEDKKALNDSLSKIYEGDDGKRINVREVKIRRRRNGWLRAALIALYIVIAAGLAYGGYVWFMSRTSDRSALELSISAPADLAANQEFSYTIVYENKQNVTLTGLQLHLTYPDNFIFSKSQPSPSEGGQWQLGDLKPYATGQLTVTGRIINQPGRSNVLFADLDYGLEGLTASYRKSVSVDTVLASSGIDIAAVGPGTALLGQEQSVSINWKPVDKNFIDTFMIRLDPLTNLVISPKQTYPAGVVEKEPGLYEVSAKPLAKPLVITFSFKEKKNDSEELRFGFEYRPSGNDKVYRFEEKVFPIEIVQNSLNLTMSANGSSADQGATFGQPISYSISYTNKGEQNMDDVIVMAVIEGDAVDWRKIEDPHNGKIVGSTIVWTKAEVPELKSIAKGQSGSIDFILPLRPGNEAPLVTKTEIRSYAQFALGDHAENLSTENSADRSNQLSLKVNSDTVLDEAARYFDEDNIAVGTGPLPPKVGETTTVKVYWKITNSLHELGSLKVTTTLPAGVSFDGKTVASAGTLSYDAGSNQVTWDIGRLPLSVRTLAAEFSIAVTPTASDRNKLMVLVSGTTLSALDSQTAFPLTQALKAQTTKLDKDDIADTDGIVQ